MVELYQISTVLERWLPALFGIAFSVCAVVFRSRRDVSGWLAISGLAGIVTRCTRSRCCSSSCGC